MEFLIQRKIVNKKNENSKISVYIIMCKFSYSHIDGSRSMRHRPTMFMQSYTFFLDFGVFFFLFVSFVLQKVA